MIKSQYIKIARNVFLR